MPVVHPSRAHGSLGHRQWSALSVGNVFETSHVRSAYHHSNSFDFISLENLSFAEVTEAATSSILNRSLLALLSVCHAAKTAYFTGTSAYRYGVFVPRIKRTTNTNFVPHHFLLIALCVIGRPQLKVENVLLAMTAHWHPLHDLVLRPFAYISLLPTQFKHIFLPQVKSVTQYVLHLARHEPHDFCSL